MPLDPHPLNEISGEILDASFRIHSELGPGLLESVYEVALARALEKRGLKVERQKQSVEQLQPVHSKKLLTYLRLMNLKIGLLINFGAPTLKAGIQRIVNGLAS